MYPVGELVQQQLSLFSATTYNQKQVSLSLRRALDRIWPMTQQINKFYL